MKIYTYKNQWGRTVQIILKKGSYLENGNLAVQAFLAENGRPGEPYANITVNIEKLGENLAAVDSNNLGAGIVTFLEHEGIAKSLGIDVYSGYCAYPIMDFTTAALEEMEEM